MELPTVATTSPLTPGKGTLLAARSHPELGWVWSSWAWPRSAAGCKDFCSSAWLPLSPSSTRAALLVRA